MTYDQAVQVVHAADSQGFVAAVVPGFDRRNISLTPNLAVRVGAFRFDCFKTAMQFLDVALFESSELAAAQGVYFD